MAKSMTVGNVRMKERLAKREAKLKRKEGRKSTKSSFDDMIAYVGRIWYDYFNSTRREYQKSKRLM